MANNVFANGHELSCKVGEGSSKASFPDPCYTPPPPPTGPLVIPYANSAYSSDTDEGSKTVLIGNKSIMKKDTSYFKTSIGNEPAFGKNDPAPCPKGGLISGVKKGKAYFSAWSMNVKVEGENAVRDIDGMTHNHGSDSTNSFIGVFMDSAEGEKSCGEDDQKVKDCCGDEKEWKKEHCQCVSKFNLKQDEKVNEAKQELDKQISHEMERRRLNNTLTEKNKEGKYLRSDGLKIARENLKNAKKERAESAKKSADEREINANQNPCLKARKCMLAPYNEKSKKPESGGCCDGQTPHHLLPNCQFQGKRGKNDSNISGCDKYTLDSAPCMCLEGSNTSHGSHGKMHKASQINFMEPLGNNGVIDYFESREAAIAAYSSVFNSEEPDDVEGKYKKCFKKCNPKCLRAQLDSYFNKACENKETKKTETTQLRSCDGIRSSKIKGKDKTAQQWMTTPKQGSSAKTLTNK